jgi:ribosomal protein S15P/S13E
MNKAQWAENLLRDDYFKEMMQDLKNQEINRFAMSETNDIDSREQAYIRLRVIESLEDHLQGMVADKKIKDGRLKIL